jgi:hypothetical protein
LATNSEAFSRSEIAEYENAAHDYVQDGVRLLELAKKAYFLFKQQNSSEKRKLLNFVCSNSIWKHQTLTATFRQPLIFLHLQTRLGKEKRPPETLPATLVRVAGHRDNLRNFFLSPQAEMLSFLQQLREAV